MTAAVAVALTIASFANSAPAPTVESSKLYNDADVALATDMIQHHAQAVQMGDLTLGRPPDQPGPRQR